MLRSNIVLRIFRACFILTNAGLTDGKYAIIPGELKFVSLQCEKKTNLQTQFANFLRCSCAAILSMLLAFVGCSFDQTHFQHGRRQVRDPDQEKGRNGLLLVQNPCQGCYQRREREQGEQGKEKIS
jgi:hypothetical protein